MMGALHSLFCSTICTVISMSSYVSAYAQAKEHVPSEIFGFWLSDDKEAIVEIKPCADRPETGCGYIVSSTDTGHDAMDRMLCGFRLFGGLQFVNEKKMQGGWFYDLETAKAYDLNVRVDKRGQVLTLRIYDNYRIKGVSMKWSRIKSQNLVAVNLSMCNP